jgi:hypothetical protein
MKNDILDQAVAAVQNQEPDPAVVDAAIHRVGDAMASPAASSPVDETPLVLRGCADIQSLVPAFVAGKLSPARALLVEDHTRSCVPCRRALKAVRSGLPLTAPAAADADSVRRWPVAAMALAASLLLCAALGALWFVRSSAASGPARQGRGSRPAQSSRAGRQSEPVAPAVRYSSSPTARASSSRKDPRFRSPVASAGRRSRSRAAASSSRPRNSGAATFS